MTAGRRYAKSHEWVSVEGDSATVGISEYAVEQLGDIVYLELPGIGKEIGAGDTLGDIESVKAVSQIYSPISGTVLEVNSELETRPELVNDSPLEGGWIVKLGAIDPSQADALMDSAAYEQFVADQP